MIFIFVQVSLGSAQEGGLTVATIHYSYRSRDSVASVFLHECDDDVDGLCVGSVAPESTLWVSEVGAHGFF